MALCMVIDLDILVPNHTEYKNKCFLRWLWYTMRSMRQAILFLLIILLMATFSLPINAHISPTFTLEEKTIVEIQKSMESGDITSKQLVQLYLLRIAEYDKHGPRINSVLEINPDALQIAEALDRERAAKGPRGPLHGIPILLKDNIGTDDKMHTSAGSMALANHHAPEDSYVVQQLREAGAVILGKTNMTEWAGFMSDFMISGYSSRGGQVLNPYGLGNMDVGGSSSGSAAAVASNFATVAIGTETAGSIIYPSSRNAIAGIKPTVGLVSRYGIIPVSHSQDTVGPMARTVADAAILLQSLAGADPRDPATVTNVHQADIDYTKCLQASGLRGARIGIPRYYYTQLSENEQKIMKKAIDSMEQQGAVIIDPVEIPSAAELDQSESGVLSYELKTNLNYYLSKCSVNVPVHSLKELIAFNNNHPKEMLKYGQNRLVNAEMTSGTLTEPEYIKGKIKDLHLSQQEGIDFAIKRHQLDALVFPSFEGSNITGKSGYPAVTVPAGYTSAGVPVGITFTAMAYSEPTLIKLAYSFEQATRHRIPPRM